MDIIIVLININTLLKQKTFNLKNLAKLFKKNNIKFRPPLKLFFMKEQCSPPVFKLIYLKL